MTVSLEYEIAVDPTDDPQQAAQAAGLLYVSGQEAGFQRKRWGRGFTFLDKDGNHVDDEAVRARLEGLVIPPAWIEVWICADECGHIQVTGRDEAGRKQYIYHPRWESARNRAKFKRMIPFGRALPQIRRQVDKDLRQRGLPLSKVVAIVVRLLEETRIRIGNPEYARHNQTYGLTTLADDHLQISGAQICFEFVGKSGKERRVDLRDQRLARHIKRCQDLPGEALFQYFDEAGNQRVLCAADVNHYLRELTGQNFSAKDFRTWAGTVLTLDELYDEGEAEDEKGADKAIVAAVKAVAEHLGNTPAVCRQYYIHPAILDAYRDGEMFEAVAEAAAEEAADSFDLSPDERAVLAILCRRTDFEC